MIIDIDHRWQTLFHLMHGYGSAAELRQLTWGEFFYNYLQCKKEIERQEMALKTA